MNPVGHLFPNSVSDLQMINVGLKAIVMILCNSVRVCAEEGVLSDAKRPSDAMIAMIDQKHQAQLELIIEITLACVCHEKFACKLSGINILSRRSHYRGGRARPRMSTTFYHVKRDLCFIITLPSPRGNVLPR
jgi:hypothetical protein